MGIRDEEGAEGGDRDHDDGNAALLLLPEGQPDDVDFPGRQTDPGDADDGDDYHHHGQAEGHTQPEFLAEVDADFPDYGDGKGEDLMGVSLPVILVL